jgi:hypothetical protein
MLTIANVDNLLQMSPRTAAIRRDTKEVLIRA